MTAGEDIYGSAEHLAFRDTVRKFVQTELVPRAREFARSWRSATTPAWPWASACRPTWPRPRSAGEEPRRVPASQVDRRPGARRCTPGPHEALGRARPGGE